MTLQELISTMEHTREQIFNAELRLDQTDPKEPELIDAAVYELRAWEIRYMYYLRKIKEAVKDGQKIQGRGLLQFGGRR